MGNGTKNAKVAKQTKTRGNGGKAMSKGQTIMGNRQKKDWATGNLYQPVVEPQTNAREVQTIQQTKGIRVFYK